MEDDFDDAVDSDYGEPIEPSDGTGDGHIVGYTPVIIRETGELLGYIPIYDN
jgi:hypothetical protein